MQRILAIFALVVCLSAGMFSVLMQTGCRPSIDKIVAREERINRDVENIFANVQELQAQGRTEDALSLIDKTLASRRYAAHRGRFFL
jgi:hypothetical protein